jgi:rsbT co-antagonist protein RsbR
MGAMTTDMMVESTIQQQLIRLRRFLSLYMPIAFIFGAVFLALAIIFRDLATGISGAAVLLNGCLLFLAWYNVKNGNVQVAVLTTSVGLLAGGLVILLVQPFFFVTLTLTPLLAIVLGLQYLTIRPLMRLIVAAGACSLIASVAGHLLPQGIIASNLPPWLRSMLEIGGAGAAVVLVMLLLWNFSVLLNGMFASLRAANRDLEAQQARLARANEQLQHQLESERQLLQLVSELETPVVPLVHDVLFAPIVGNLDSRRAESLRAHLLEAVHANRSRLLILDITGVATIDTAVAQALLLTTQALRLLGCRVIISGISATIAMTLTHLGVDLRTIETVQSPETVVQSLVQIRQN